MERRNFLRMAACAAAGPIALSAQAGEKPSKKKPNILFITVDDMNCDSVGVFGAEMPDTTPHLDRLAAEGVRFEYAHVQVANCVPSRNVMQSGRYPHTSGVEGFYKVRPAFPILPDLMKSNGYYTAIKGKITHSTPYQPYAWDMALDIKDEKPAVKGDTKVFYQFTKDVIDASLAEEKSFYAVVNIIDPHKPFYALGKQAQVVPDENKPTRVYNEDEVVVPKFLPDFPVTRVELAHYYSSVRRADDCVAATLRALADSGEADNTVVMFLSDHGMPFPFAKTNVYHHSTRTPWIVRWPGRVKPGSIDRKHMISAIDFMPTVLDIAGVSKPAALQGRSFLPLLLGKTQVGRDYIIKEYNENSGGARHPMRAIETRDYCYIFNPWANGERRYRTATQGMETYKEMVRQAPTNKAIATRLRLFDYRVVEELYDCRRDRDALHNLIDDPSHKKELDRLRGLLEQWMVETKDHCLSAFRNRRKPEAMEAYMQKQERESKERRSKIRAKKKNAAEKKPGARSGRNRGGAKILTLSPPTESRRGQSVTLGVNYKIPVDLGEQLIHVTLKDQDGKRIERKVEKAKGAGALKVDFAVPNDASLKGISFAVFIGEDFQSNLQILATNLISLK